MSETRGIAMQAVQELMSQQNELRAQQEAHAKHKRDFAVASLVVLLLLALLAGGLFYFRNDLGLIAKKTDEHGQMIAEQGKTLEKTTENIRKLGTDVDSMADKFGKIDQQLEDQKKQQAKTDQTLNQVALNVAKAEAAQRGGMDKLGASLDQINQRVAKLRDKPAVGDAAVRNPAVAPAPGVPEKPIRCRRRGCAKPRRRPRSGRPRETNPHRTRSKGFGRHQEWRIFHRQLYRHDRQVSQNSNDPRSKRQAARMGHPRSASVSDARRHLRFQ
jgi:hypothetical protein